MPQKTHDRAVCVVAANDYAIKQLDITRERIINYAKKCNAQYIELNGDKAECYVMYNKYRIEQVTSVYDKTLYLDCDVIVSDDAPNIFSVCNEDKIYFANEWYILKSSSLPVYKSLSRERKEIANLLLPNSDLKIGMQPNAGVMVIPNKLSHKYSQPEQPYPKKWCFDQHFLILGLQENEYQILNWRYNLEFMSNDFWDKLPYAYFIHTNGTKTEEYRLRLLKRLNSGVFDYYDSE